MSKPNSLPAEHVRGLRVEIGGSQVQYPELLAQQVEMSIQACRQQVLDNGGTLGRIEGGKIVPGDFVEVVIYVETRFLTDPEEQDVCEA